MKNSADKNQKSLVEKSTSGAIRLYWAFIELTRHDDRTLHSRIGAWLWSTQAVPLEAARVRRSECGGRRGRHGRQGVAPDRGRGSHGRCCSARPARPGRPGGSCPLHRKTKISHFMKIKVAFNEQWTPLQSGICNLRHGSVEPVA